MVIFYKLVKQNRMLLSTLNNSLLIGTHPLPIRRTGNRGGLLLLVREDTPSKTLKTFNKKGILIQINLKKCKWPLFGGYNPHKNYTKDFLVEVQRQLDNLMHCNENLGFGKVVILS